MRPLIIEDIQKLGQYHDICATRKYEHIVTRDSQTGDIWGVSYSNAKTEPRVLNPIIAKKIWERYDANTITT